MAKNSHVHWFTPTSMVASLLAGILFALGHHLFYHSLAGKSVTGETYELGSTKVSRQQLNTAIGTAFAFLTKASLSSAVSLAYLQAVWAVAKQQKRPLTVGDIDMLLAGLGNALTLGNVVAWWKWPLLLLVLLIAWLIPTTSIVTPATLTVGVESPPPQFLNVPTVAFRSLNLLASMHSNPNNGISDCYAKRDSECHPTIGYGYSGPSNAVSRIVAATAAQGYLAQVAAPAANASWTTLFRGPSLRCDNVAGDLRSMFESNIADFVLSGSCARGPGFLAWTPQMSDDTLPDLMVPFLKEGNGSYYLNTGLATDRLPGNIATLFMAATPSVMKQMGAGNSVRKAEACFMGSDSQEQKVARLLNNSAILRCDLYNSTYRAEFKFVNGLQEVNVTTSELEDAPMSTVSFVRSLADITQPTSGATCDIMSTTTQEKECMFDMRLMEKLSYQAIMDAFTQQVVGKLSWTQNSNYAFIIDANTSIATTVLSQTPELAFLNDYDQLSSDHWNFLQDPLGPTHWKDSLYYGLVNTPPRQSSILLKDAIEKLFENITISLMSEPSVQPNSSSAFYPPPTLVTFSTYHNIYIYSQYKLWLAYGLAIGCSAVLVVAGLVLTYVNGASFSYKFSSILRLSRGIDLGVDIDRIDVDGRDPLPKYIKKAVVKLPNENAGTMYDEVRYTQVME